MSVTLLADDLTGACDTGTLFADSEDGLFGDEEKTAIIPALETATAEGLVVTGFPARRHACSPAPAAASLISSSPRILARLGRPRHRLRPGLEGTANAESMIEAIEVAVRMLSARTRS